jgi:hypothetical protein
MVEIKLKELTDEQFKSMRNALKDNRAYKEKDIILHHKKGTDEYSVVLAPLEEADEKPIVEVSALVEMCTLITPNDNESIDTNKECDGIKVEGV